MRILLILRSYQADASTLASFDRYASLRSADVVICFDERRGPVDAGGRAKLGFSAEMLTKLGLFQHPACGWRCGDYFYYVTRAAMPDYDFYWLVEPDVVLNTADINATFERLNATEADFLAPRFGHRDATWGWHRMMRHRYQMVYGCIFPITRLSARAIDHLHAARRSAVMPSSPAMIDGWPNDEVFVSTELQNHGFTCQELCATEPHLYTRHTMRTGVPWDREALATRPPDGLIYHPVRQFSVWFEQQSKWLADYAVSRRGMGHVHFRGNVWRLRRLASIITEHRALYDAGLFPMMLTSRVSREAGYLDENGQHGPYREIEANPIRDVQTLARRFHPGRNGRSFATGYLLAENKHSSCEPIAAAGDFSWSDAEPLRVPPLAFALPYACDFDGGALLFTVHPLPRAILSADRVLEEQRRQACVGCRVDFRHLHRFYPAPSTLPAISFLLIDDSAARTEAAKRLRAMGRQAIADPPALVQLARQSDRFLALRRRWWSPVMWAAIAPVFTTYGATGGPIVFVVSEDIMCLKAILQTLPGEVFFTHDFDEAAKVHSLEEV